MEAYPQKIRELVLSGYEQGLPTAEVARKYEVSRSWARRVKHRLQEFNTRERIQQKHGFDPKLGEAERKELTKLVEEAPDSTLNELRKSYPSPSVSARSAGH
jgi:transposase